MNPTEAKPYLETINARKQNFVAKFEVFAQKLRCKKDVLPEDFADGLDLMADFTERTHPITTKGPT